MRHSAFFPSEIKVERMYKKRGTPSSFFVCKEKPNQIQSSQNFELELIEILSSELCNAREVLPYIFTLWETFRKPGKLAHFIGKDIS